MYPTVIFQIIIKRGAHGQNSVSLKKIYFCCFWINVTQINFENIQNKIQRIISDSRFQLKSRFNIDARAPSIPLLNFPFNNGNEDIFRIHKKNYCSILLSSKNIQSCSLWFCLITHKLNTRLLCFSQFGHGLAYL